MARLPGSWELGGGKQEMLLSLMALSHSGILRKAMLSKISLSSQNLFWSGTWDMAQLAALSFAVNLLEAFRPLLPLSEASLVLGPGFILFLIMKSLFLLFRKKIVNGQVARLPGTKSLRLGNQKCCSRLVAL